MSFLSIASRLYKCRTSFFFSPRLQDLHAYFPHLLGNIFGYNGTDGWCLKMLTPRQHPNDFKLVLEFLQPDGFLFTLIGKLHAHCGMYYEFPIDLLPVSGSTAFIWTLLIRAGHSGLPDTHFQRGVQNFVVHVIHDFLSLGMCCCIVHYTMCNAVFR